jgi:hypothetical protein
VTGRQKGPRPDLIAALSPLAARFGGQPALVFAPGPSLPKLWSVDRELPCPAIAIGDAWRLARKADVLYHSDALWWRHHRLVPDFAGMKIGTHECRYVKGLLCLEMTGVAGFDPRLGMLRYGLNSGHAAIHLAAQLGASPIVLVGFDQRMVGGRNHWFGEHPREIRGHRDGSPYQRWIGYFAELAVELQRRGISVLNATPNSALDCFPEVRLEDLWPAPSV